MREIEVTATFDALRADIERKLSPTAIVEYAGTYTVESVDDSGEKTVVSGTGEEMETVLAFTKQEDGYVYSQRGTEGPFEEMRTRITVEDIEAGTQVRVRSTFTFGGWSAFLTDWLGTDIRRDELQRLLYGLASDLETNDD